MSKARNNDHSCRLFDLVKTGDEKYQCQFCKKIHDQKTFEDLKKATSIRYCHCGGTEKLMELHIPHPVSGWTTKPVFLVCLYCGGKYMYYKFCCDTEGCRNNCDISEVYCQSCRKKNEL